MESLEERLGLSYVNVCYVMLCIFACIPDYHCFWLFGTYIRWTGPCKSWINCLADKNTHA